MTIYLRIAHGLASLGVALVATSAHGFEFLSGSTDLVARLVPVDNTPGGEELRGFVTTDIDIDFLGIWTGSQLLIELDAGSFYRHPLGEPDGSTPDPTLFAQHPALVFDTSVATTLPGMGAVDLGAGIAPVLPDHGDIYLSRSWNPPGGYNLLRPAVPDPVSAAPRLRQAAAVSAALSVFPDGADFFSARVTLTDDAAGRFAFLASANGELLFAEGRVVNGALVPEPTTLVFGICAAALGLASHRSRRG